MDLILFVLAILAIVLAALVYGRKSKLSRGALSMAPGVPPAPTAAPQVFALDDVAQLHQEARDLLSQQLMRDESVRVIIRGPWDQAIIATERRLFIFKRGFMGGATFGRKMTSWDYRNINGVYFETSSLHGVYAAGVIAVEVPGSPAVDKGFMGSSEMPNMLPITQEFFEVAAKGVAEIRRLIAEHQSAAAVPQASVGQELERLASLHERGHLTDEEFATMKHRLLAS